MSVDLRIQTNHVREIEPTSHDGGSKIASCGESTLPRLGDLERCLVPQPPTKVIEAGLVNYELDYQSPKSSR